jgi:hypothetical protein
VVGGFDAHPAQIDGFPLEQPSVAQAAVVKAPAIRLGLTGRA